MKKKIVFVISSGRSGSTLLCKFLGMHSSCFPLSEPQRYDMATETNGYCSCEEKLLDCPFWSGVRKRLEERGHSNGYLTTSRYPFYKQGSRLGKLKAYLDLYLLTRGLRKLPKNDYFMQLRNEAELLQAISSESEQPVLIDASKSFVRAVGLSRLLKKNFDAHYVFLYREPLSVIYSSMKKNMSVQLDDKEIVYSKKNLPSLEEAVDNWCRGNRSNLTLSRIFNVNPSFVCYEEFARDPQSSFERISSDLGLEWEDSMLDLSQSGHHMVSGNLSRINAKVVNPPKEEWRQMNEDDQAFVRKHTDPVLQRIESKVRGN